MMMMMMEREKDEWEVDRQTDRQAGSRTGGTPLRWV